LFLTILTQGGNSDQIQSLCAHCNSRA